MYEQIGADKSSFICCMHIDNNCNSLQRYLVSWWEKFQTNQVLLHKTKPMTNSLEIAAAKKTHSTWRLSFVLMLPSSCTVYSTISFVPITNRHRFSDTGYRHWFLYCVSPAYDQNAMRPRICKIKQMAQESDKCCSVQKQTCRQWQRSDLDFDIWSC